MTFHVAPHAARIIFELPARRGEGVADDDVNILVRPADFEVLDPLARAALHRGTALRWLVSHDNFPARHVDMDADVKALAAFVLLMRRFDHHAATGDARVVTIQLRRFLLNARGDRRGRFHVPKGDLDGRYHKLNDVALFVAPARAALSMAAQAARERKGPAACLCQWRAFARVPVAIPYEVVVVMLTVRSGAGRFREQPEAARRDVGERPAVAPEGSPPVAA